MPSPRKKPEERKRPARPSEGRPEKPIDLVVVERAASIGCTPEEIATVCKIGRSAFFDRMKTHPEVADAIDRGRENGRATLRRLQWQRANAGSDTMQIWLGKQLLGQRDKQAVEHGVDEGLEMILDRIARRAA
jgi:hypothetical protein